MRGRVNIDDLRQEGHIVFTTAAGDVAYGFSQQAFRNCPTGYAADLIARQMAQYLVNNPNFRQLMEQGRGINASRGR